MRLHSVVQLAGASSHKTKSCRFNSQWGLCPGCGFSPWSGCMQEAANRFFSLTLRFVSLLLFLSFPLSKINKHVLRWRFKKKRLKVFKTLKWPNSSMLNIQLYTENQYPDYKSYLLCHKKNSKSSTTVY